GRWSPRRSCTAPALARRAWSKGFLAAVFAFMAIAAGRAAATDVTACFQTVFTRDTGVLQVDLTCDDSAAAVYLQPGATLQMGGHTITGGGIYCASTCQVIGPGTVQQVVGSGNQAGIEGGSSGGALTVRDVTLTSNGLA